jgi:hypothetical protein
MQDKLGVGNNVSFSQPENSHETSLILQGILNTGIVQKHFGNVREIVH